MNHIFLRLVFVGTLGLLSLTLAHAEPVRGLIVRLRDAPAPANAITVTERRAAHNERVATLARDASLSLRSHRPLTERHQLMRLAQPLQGAQLDAAIRRLRLHPDVAWVEKDVLLKRMSTPSDPGFTQQGQLLPPGTDKSAINLTTAWDRTVGHASVTVAVIDSGIVKSNADLVGRFLPGYDFVSDLDISNDGDGWDADPADPGDWVSASEVTTPAFQGCDVESSSWHGTFIAGQLVASANNGFGMAGVNWVSKLLPVRVAGKCGALLSDVVTGMRWAAGLAVEGAPINPNPARIISLSFGGDQTCDPANGTLYQEAINSIVAAGALVITAAGNGNGRQLLRPADCPGAVAVGAVRTDGMKEAYSSVGPNLGLMAPGGPIYSLSNSGSRQPVADSFTTKSGTSFATPLVAGVASLMLSLNPALKPEQLVARLRAGTRAHVFNALYPTCSNTNLTNGICNCTTSTCGAGMLDADNATRLALDPAVTAVAPDTATGSTAVALDGRSSAAALGASIASYRWTQLSGPLASISNGTQALASAALSHLGGTLVFELLVSDNLGRTSREQVSMVVSATAPPSTGGGGGASSMVWGAALWLLVAATWWQQRRRRLPA